MAQTNEPGPQRRRRTGAYAVGEDTARRRPGWLIPLLALLGLLLIGLVLWAALRNRNSDSTAPAVATPSTGAIAPTPTTSAGTLTTSPGTASASASAGGGGGTAADGQLVSNGQSLLPLAAGSSDLSRYAGQTATARMVTVQSVPADEGFWVGTSVTDRVWVQLVGGGESPVAVKAGDRISFATGKVVATPAGYADRVGVDAAEGAVQLGQQRAHIEIAKNSVRLSP